MKNKAISHNMDETRDYCTKWNQSYREREIYDITYIWNLRNDSNELIYKTEIDLKTKKTNSYDYKRGKGSGWKNWVGNEQVGSKLLI